VDLSYNGESVDNTVREELQRLVPNPKALLASARAWDQQNPPVLNWRCRLTRVDVYNGCKTVVVVAVVVVAQSTRFNSCAVDNVHSESRHPSAVAELLVLRAGRITAVLGEGGKGEASPLWVDVQKLCNMCVHCSKCVSFWGTSYSRPPIDPYLTPPLLQNPGGATALAGHAKHEMNAARHGRKVGRPGWSRRLCSERLSSTLLRMEH